jgi:hypothetical protein
MKIVFCNGQPKSGSTFLFELVKRLLPHLDLRSIGDELGRALESDDEASGILYREAGSYTGFVEGSIAGAARIFSKLPLPNDRHLVVKTHDPKPAPAPFLPGSNLVVTTFRDPLDVMVALYEQNHIELSRPAFTIRPAFLVNQGYAKALASTEKFLTGMTRYFTPHNLYLEYPSFIRPSPQEAAEIAEMLGVDATQVVDAAAGLDRDIRAGMVNAEFNRGETGRGRQVIEDLVRNGTLSRRLVQKAVRRYGDLVGLVVRHRCGVVANQ